MAVSESQKTGVMLGDVLLRLDWITQEQLQMSLAVQSGAQLLDTDAIKVDPGLITQVPQEFVTTHGMMPLQKRGDTILAATNNPFDVVAKDKLARITGCQVETYIASKEWLTQAIELYYKTALAIDTIINQKGKDLICIYVAIGQKHCCLPMSFQVIDCPTKFLRMGKLAVKECMATECHRTSIYTSIDAAPGQHMHALGRRVDVA